MRYGRTNIPKRRQRRIIAVGDLNTKIKIQSRRLFTQFETGLNDQLDFDSTDEDWALIETGRGKQEFDGVNLINAYTHFIYIRYRPDITQEKWVLHNGQRYDIVDVEDLDDRHEFLLLRCKETGTSDFENKASETG